MMAHAWQPAEHAASSEARAEACSAPLSRCCSREVVKARLMPPAIDIVGGMRSQQLRRNQQVGYGGSRWRQR